MSRIEKRVDIAAARSVYDFYHTEKTFLESAVRRKDARWIRRELKGARRIIDRLPTWEALKAEEAENSCEGSALEKLWCLVNRIHYGPDIEVDGIRLKDAKTNPQLKIFPFKEDGKFRINTGNIQQLGKYLSELLIAYVELEGELSPGSIGDAVTILNYLEKDYVQQFWIDLSAWHWAGAFNDGMGERIRAKLSDHKNLRKRDFFKAITDYEMHVVTTAADIRSVLERSDSLWRFSKDYRLMRDVSQTGLRIMRERAKTNNGVFSFDESLWDDNPISFYARCEDRDKPINECRKKSYAQDISPAQRWPAWFKSLARVARRDEKVKLLKLEIGFIRGIEKAVHWKGDQPLLKNFIDGTDGWYVAGVMSNNNAHSPSSLTGWALRYGGYYPYIERSEKIKKLTDSFCKIITSAGGEDIAFRKKYYGDSSGEQKDDYNNTGIYREICMNR